MIPALMVSMAIVDAGFAGFRAAAGRNARIFKVPYFRRAVWLGAAAGAGLAALLAVLTLAALAAVREPGALWADLLAIGARMLAVLLTYAALVIAAMALYLTASLDLRILATVAILGPFTFLRPWVVVAATAFGLAASRSAVAAALTVAASGSVLLLGRALDWRYGRAVPG